MRRYVVFVLIVFPLFLSQIVSTSVAVAFPTMVSHFGTSLILAGWVLGIYQLVSIGAIPIASKLSDNVGRRSTFVFCLVLFTVGSFLCSVAPNMGWLIVFRIIQAAGGGGFTSAAVGIITDQFADKRQQLIGLTTSIISFGSIIGPGVGGVLVEYLGWQSVFWVNIPFGIMTLILSKFFIKADVKKSGSSQLDLLGIALLTGSVSAVMISLTLMGKDYNVPAVVIALVAILGLFSLVIFFVRTKTHPNGVVNRELLTSRPFIATNVYHFVFGACTQGGVMALIPLYAISVYSMSVLESGVIVSIRSIGLFVVSIITSFSLSKWGYHRPIILGSILVSLGFVLLAFEPGKIALDGISLNPFILVTVFCLFTGIGAGVAAPAANNACIDLMPDKAAIITGLRQIVRQIGGAISISVSTLVLQSSTNVARGFTLLLISFGALQLLAIIAVFSMPEHHRFGQRYGEFR